MTNNDNFTSAPKTAFNQAQDKDYAAAVTFGTSMIEGRDDEKEEARYTPISLMFKHRIVLAFGQVNTEMAYNLIPQLKQLEKLSPDEPITMLINSPGGSVIDGMAVVDMMREIKCPINTVGIGMQASMGSIFLAAGGDAGNGGSRKMCENAQLMIHQIASGGQGKHSELALSIEHASRLHEDLKSVYVAATGLNFKFWDKALEFDSWLTATQALELGIIDQVVKGEKPANRYTADAVRPASSRNFTDKAFDAIKETEFDTSAKILEALNSVSGNGAEFARWRGEMIVMLSKFPEFWTPMKKAEMDAKTSNDNVKKAVPAAKAPKPAVK